MSDAGSADSPLLVTSGALEFVILPQLAGRVAEMRFSGKNLLGTPSEHADNWGTTYWTSPQADWGWPPVAEVDALAYSQSGAKAGEVQLLSPEAQIGERRFHVEKSFKPGPKPDSIDTVYSIKNIGAASFKMANWEIMRVPAGGLTFFPTGDAELTPIAPHSAMSTEKEAGTTFFDHQKFEVGACQKLHADGRGGYLAHLMGELLVLKLFVDAAPAEQAPGEGECEIFANEDGKYVEVEVQGRYAEIAPGGENITLIRTAVVQLPAEVDPSDRSALREFTDAQAALFAVET